MREGGRKEEGGREEIGNRMREEEQGGREGGKELHTCSATHITHSALLRYQKLCCHGHRTLDAHKPEQEKENRILTLSMTLPLIR